jgi:phosphoribosylformylglycinamidine cyclo-ligase
LARRALGPERGFELGGHVPDLGGTLGETLLTPTRIYAASVAKLSSDLGADLHALCHVTGGGVTGNLPRVLQTKQCARVDGNFARGKIFELIAENGPVELDEMRRTFNLGVGLIAVVAEGAAHRAVASLHSGDEDAWVLGSVEASGEAEPFVRYT